MLNGGIPEENQSCNYYVKRGMLLGDNYGYQNCTPKKIANQLWMKEISSNDTEMFWI